MKKIIAAWDRKEKRGIGIYGKLPDAKLKEKSSWASKPKKTS